MSTPTNLQKHPAAAAHATAHHGTTTTPNALGAFPSPAPRSVPSPAATRKEAGKSPFNASHSHTKGLVGSSPAAAAISFDSPGAMGLGLGALGALDGGVGMGISMSGMSGLGLGMGLGSSMGGRPDDTEQRKRLEGIVATLKARPGRVSKEGLERLAKQLGLSSEVLSDASGEQVLLAHTSIMLDVTFRRNAVENVSVSFGALSEAIQKHEDSAARIFKDDLSPAPGAASINLSLEKFSKNLERLARLDNLSIFKDGKPEVSCFEAINGVYTSLLKLFEHEKKTAKALFDASGSNADEKAAREVLCKKSGRPRMNVNKTVGLSWEYWMERRSVFSKHRKAPDADNDTAMDIDDSDDASSDESADRIYSLTIECESSPAHLYPSIRVSDSWVSDTVEKASDPNDLFDASIIDWLDPPPSYSGATDSAQNDPMALDGMGKLPNVRFVAKLNPPLVLPANTAQQILASVNAQVNENTVRWVTLDAGILKPEEEAAAAALGPQEPKQYSSVKNVLVVDEDGREHDRRHQNTLFVNKPEFCRVVDEIPFDHPRQITQILPILRQYAHLTSLLQASFCNDASPAAAEAEADAANPSLPISIGVAVTGPSPTLTVVYPRSNSAPQQDQDQNQDQTPHHHAPIETLDALLAPAAPAGLVTLAASILPNADVAISEQNLLAPPLERGQGQGEGEGAGERVQEDQRRRIRALERLGRALELSADVGVWVEWAAGRGGRL
ncbi:uncharacterized protein K452DRAFT_278893 [Aplosporella prunicola CBS 121167]|uniref:Mediator of RNA polymerase II transcription subunit 1 n=1 Tax=Aplosporella prunicola CBS 121167 TaxID=1176127 RepID=A0A6A6B1I2_9PEZI|nr:uncharacterized protein K452DRAFT_278893 [Aplosporella prunicola CBS 121167]KAF2137233.1 hypothetical protein K452DRAFT_278893 [Aplosporella prunicola CBS 121167]